MPEERDKGILAFRGCKAHGQGRFEVAEGKGAPLFNIPLRCIGVFSRLAMIFVLLAQGLERIISNDEVDGSNPSGGMFSD